MATFSLQLQYGIVELPAAQIEFVATDAAYEGRGLVRRQFDYHHADLQRRGEGFQVIVGIPYFYRRFGYEYALPVADWRTVPAGEIPAMPDGWGIRPATGADAGIVASLQTPARTAADVVVKFAPDLGRIVLDSPVYDTVIAEHHGEPAATGRLYRDDADAYVLDPGATGSEGIAAVLAGLAARAPDQSLTILERPGMRPLLAGLGSAAPSGDAYYARIDDPVGFLNAIKPELERRLVGSDLAPTSGDGLISLYTSSIRFDYANGRLGEFTADRGEQAPVSKGGSGVAPDQFVNLVVGPHGFAGLADMHPEINGGKQQALMETLFPPLVSDVQSWVVP
jgi:hypothetical protein